MILTRDIILSAGPALNWHQFKLLGVSWPPPRGWMASVIGLEVSDEKWQFILSLKGKSKAHRDILLRMHRIAPQKLAQMSNAEALELPL